MKNNKFELLFVTAALLVLLSACGTSVTEAPNLPKPTPYDTQASSDDKQRLDFFRQGGIWNFLLNSPDDSEWIVVILAKENALSGAELKLGQTKLPNANSFDAAKLVLRLFSAKQEERDTFFRLYADGIDQGDFEAFLVKTAPIGKGASVPLSNATSLTKQEFLDLVIPK